MGKTWEPTDVVDIFFHICTVFFHELFVNKIIGEECHYIFIKCSTSLFLSYPYLLGFTDGLPGFLNFHIHPEGHFKLVHVRRVAPRFR